MGVMNSVSNAWGGRWLRAACLAFLLVPALSAASVENAEQLGLPESRHLSAALSDPESRIDTLLTLAAVQRLADYGRYARAHEVSEYAERFRRDRAWLDRLARHYLELPLRSSLFDPAAWLLLLELDQHDLSPGPAVSPFGPGMAGLNSMLFDPSMEIPATTVLPEVLSRIESSSTLLWEDLLEAASGNVALAAILQQLDDEWFDIWIAAEPPAPSGDGEMQEPVRAAAVLLAELGSAVQRPGPPDALDLKRLRFSLLTAMPGLTWRESNDAILLLAVANAVDGLYRQQYLVFTETMLWAAASLLAWELPAVETPLEITVESPFPPPPKIELERLPGELPPPEPYRSPVPDVLAELLPAMTSVFGGALDGVDPRLNTALAAVFDVVQYIRTGQGDPNQLNSLRMALADSVAQFVLLIPDMDYYYSQPVRREIASEINICVSRAASRDESGASTLGRPDFDRCLNNFADMAATLASASELAGDPDGPFGMEQLRRELLLTPWQRINYVLGYLLETETTGCEAPEEALPNPLEWSSLVTVLTWFARQSPLWFQAPENEALVTGLRQQGRDMLAELTRQVDCISGTGTGVNDPVLRSLREYRVALDELQGGLRAEELAFREARLEPGADIVIDRGSTQRTAWRPEGLEISPCDESRVCEMSGQLEVSGDLVNLFPDVYFVADQAGMGSVDICYDNVRWVERRSEFVREDDPHVANYHGRLSFDLVGRFNEGDESHAVFGFHFVSPDEYHYLFGPASEEVLEDACPTEWVGTRIVTGLNRAGGVRVVPDRLTYLAAARSLPSRLMAANWNRGQQWRDGILSAAVARPHDIERDTGFDGRVDQHLRDLYRAEQMAVYSALLTPPPRTWRGTPDSLHAALQDLSTHKSLLRAYVNLFFPLFLVDSDAIRGSLEGVDSLLDESVIRDKRRANADITALLAEGNAALEAMLAYWNKQPEGMRRRGSVATSLAHAIIRLDSLYRDFFAPPQAPPPDPVSPRERLNFDDLSG